MLINKKAPSMFLLTSTVHKKLFHNYASISIAVLAALAASSVYASAPI
jgi:hypothetical protein